MQVEDKHAKIINNQILNNRKIVLSKKYGLISTISFTNLDTVRYYTLYREIDEPIMLTEHLNFKIGDEIHVIEGNQHTLPPRGGQIDSTNGYIVSIKEDRSSSTHQCLKSDYDWWFLDQPGSIRIGNSDW